MSEDLIVFLIAISIILTVVGAVSLACKIISKYDEKQFEKIGDIVKEINIDEMVIEKLDRYVDIKMMSGDKFKEIDMQEYESINDPMKKGSYRIHRKAIESEHHYSKGNGYVMHKGSKIKVKIHGDENMNVVKIIDDESTKSLEKLLNIERIHYILWDFRDNTVSVDYHHSWTEDTYKLER